VLLKHGLQSANHIHQNQVKDSKHLKRVSNHLGVQIRVMIKHVARINVKRISFNFNNLSDQFLILPFGVQVQPVIITLRRRRFPKVPQKPVNRIVHVFHAYASAPHEGGPGVVHVVAIAAVRRGTRVICCGGRCGGNTPTSADAMAGARRGWGGFGGGESRATLRRGGKCGGSRGAAAAPTSRRREGVADGAGKGVIGGRRTYQKRGFNKLTNQKIRKMKTARRDRERICTNRC